MSYKAEYIWVDGQKPTAKMRSKGKVIPDGEEPPIWAFDGSSTNQATGDNSDCVLNPVFVCPDPIRRGDNETNESPAEPFIIQMETKLKKIKYFQKFEK